MYAAVSACLQCPGSYAKKPKEFDHPLRGIIYKKQPIRMETPGTKYHIRADQNGVFVA